MIAKILNFTVLLLMAIMFMWINYNYVYPVVDSNMKYCDDMHTKGYFSRNDIVAHYNCTVGLKVGPSECDFIQRKIINEEDKQYCFSYDDYNEDCEFDRAQYGSRCVWGSFGWMIFGARIFLWALTFTILLIAFMTLFQRRTDEKNEIERYRSRLQRSR